MERNCVILIDCFSDYELTDHAIQYIDQYKPKFVVGAGYNLTFWTPVRGTELTINGYGQAQGLFDCLGDHSLPFNSQIKQHLNKVNIPLVNITSAEKFVEYAISKNISSLTIMGSSWGNCLHTRELGINHLPKLLPKNIRFLAYPSACANKADEPHVIYQIKRDSDWLEVPDTSQQIWEFTGRLQTVIEESTSILPDRRAMPNLDIQITRRERPAC